jgi:hypothetical protein
VIQRFLQELEMEVVKNVEAKKRRMREDGGSPGR